MSGYQNRKDEQWAAHYRNQGRNTGDQPAYRMRRQSSQNSGYADSEAMSASSSSNSNTSSLCSWQYQDVSLGISENPRNYTLASGLAQPWQAPNVASGSPGQHLGCSPSALTGTYSQAHGGDLATASLTVFPDDQSSPSAAYTSRDSYGRQYQAPMDMGSQSQVDCFSQTQMGTSQRQQQPRTLACLGDDYSSRLASPPTDAASYESMTYHDARLSVSPNTQLLESPGAEYGGGNFSDLNELSGVGGYTGSWDENTPMLAEPSSANDYTHPDHYLNFDMSPITQLDSPQHSSSKSSKSSGKCELLCGVPGCKSAAKFARKADLERHTLCVHNPDSIDKFDCPKQRCQRKGSNGFKRKDHLTEHLRQYHNEYIPKRSKGQRSANDTGRSQGQSHSY